MPPSLSCTHTHALTLLVVFRVFYLIQSHVVQEIVTNTNLINPYFENKINIQQERNWFYKNIKYDHLVSIMGTFLPK